MPPVIAMLESFGRLTSLLREVGITGLLDMAIVTLVIYTFMVVVKRTRRSGLIFTGILITGAVYLAALKFDLKLTATLLQGFFAVILVALVVIFQEDLRYFFERVALWWVERRLPLYKRKTARLPAREVEILARTLGDLARARIGALVVVRGKDLIARHLVGGRGRGRLAERTAAQEHFRSSLAGTRRRRHHRGQPHRALGLPSAALQASGQAAAKRHPPRRRAGIGGTERRALSGGIGRARHHLRRAPRARFSGWLMRRNWSAVLEAFYREVMPTDLRAPWQSFFRRNYREKAVAFGASVLLWTVLVYRSQTIHRSFDVPVTFNLLPAPLAVTTCDPPAVLVTLAGQRKDFGFLKASDVKLAFRALGRQVRAGAPSPSPCATSAFRRDWNWKISNRARCAYKSARSRRQTACQRPDHEPAGPSTSCCAKVKPKHR